MHFFYESCTAQGVVYWFILACIPCLVVGKGKGCALFTSSIVNAPQKRLYLLGLGPSVVGSVLQYNSIQFNSM